MGQKHNLADLLEMPRKPVEMKFKNGDISLDEAVKDIIDSNEEFTLPNVDLLIRAAMDTPWE